MTDLHDAAEAVRKDELARFSELSLIEMAKELTELLTVKPCNLCAELGRPCVVHGWLK